MSANRIVLFMPVCSSICQSICPWLYLCDISIRPCSLGMSCLCHYLSLGLFVAFLHHVTCLIIPPPGTCICQLCFLYLVDMYVSYTSVLESICVATAQIQEIGDGPFRKVLEDLGSWPIVAPSWDRLSFVLEDTLAKLRSKYNTQVLVKTVVGPDDKNSSVNIIQVRYLPWVGLLCFPPN